MAGDFLMISHGVEDIWTKFQYSDNFARVFMVFGLSLPKFQAKTWNLVTQTVIAD